MTKIFKPTDGSKPIWGRSATTMAAVLISFREIVPEAPWWASLVLATVVVGLQQVFQRSVPRKDLPS